MDLHTSKLKTEGNTMELAISLMTWMILFIAAIAGSFTAVGMLTTQKQDTLIKPSTVWPFEWKERARNSTAKFIMYDHGEQVCKLTPKVLNPTHMATTVDRVILKTCRRKVV